MLDAEILGIFLDEASDILSNWEKECLVLEKSIDNPEFSALFRCAHNIKGSAKSVGLEELGDFVHHVEDIINLLQNGQIKLIPKMVEFLLDCQSTLFDWLEGLRDDMTFKPSTKELMAKAEAIKDFAKKKSTGEQIEWKDFGTLAQELAGVSPEEVKHAADLQKRRLGEIMVDEGMIQQDQAEAILKTQETQKKQGVKPSGGESIRISANKVDQLIQLIGELSIHQSMIAHAKKTRQLDSITCHNAINLASKINSEIQSHALSLRMLPLEGLLQRLERIVRDLARNQGKLINVIVEGQEVELDKTIIERITDPLIHIIRNAVDHGIEDLMMRQECGKDETATVRIAAKQDTSGIIIRVVDDGKGLDEERILTKAVEKGLISADAEIDHSQVFNLIFEPGFSTAEQVTDVSGRGVGMDVVKKSVDAVGGTVDIESKKGLGTTFTITLPTSLSIIDAFIVEVTQSRYIVPLLELSEIIDLNSYNLERTSSGERMLNLRGKVIPVESLADYFPATRNVVIEQKAKESKKNKGRPALILDISDNKIAFEVDEIVGQSQIVVRPLNHQLSKIPGYSGGSIMADGEAGMILTLKNIAQGYIDKHSAKGNA